MKILKHLKPSVTIRDRVFKYSGEKLKHCTFEKCSTYQCKKNVFKKSYMLLKIQKTTNGKHIEF